MNRMLSKTAACDSENVCEHAAAVDVQGSEQESERQRGKSKEAGAKGNAVTWSTRISSATPGRVV
jgi:hypothetical protein